MSFHIALVFDMALDFSEGALTFALNLWHALDHGMPSTLVTAAFASK
jgi:hypothetical protein